MFLACAERFVANSRCHMSMSKANLASKDFKSFCLARSINELRYVSALVQLDASKWLPFFTSMKKDPQKTQALEGQ